MSQKTRTELLVAFLEENPVMVILVVFLLLAVITGGRCSIVIKHESVPSDGEAVEARGAGS